MSDIYYAAPGARYPNNPFDSEPGMIDMQTGKIIPTTMQDTLKVDQREKPASQAVPFTQPRDLGEGVDRSASNPVVIIKGNLDPTTIMAMARTPTDPERRVGAYVENGQVFVHVDALSIEKAYDYLTKEMAYNHRHAINMSDAGIQPYVASMLLDSNANPPSLFANSKEFKDNKVYRAIFLLTRGI